MQDWFVPILYQEKHDLQLFDQLPSDKAEKMSQQQRQTQLGHLPDTPTHSFIGRSRQLLTLERLLQQQPYAVIEGHGGIGGKTTIAVELTRWLVQTDRFDRCAFVSLEEYSHDRAVLDELGKQLVGESYSVAEYSDFKKAIQRVLENKSCLLLLDNMESLLADNDKLKPVLQLTNGLLASDHTACLLFTSRESLPAPFNHQARQVSLGELSKDDAKQLIINVMNQQGLMLKHDDQGRTPEEVNALITAVNGHARALVLLARELSIQGVTATTENLHAIMQNLEQEHPGERKNSLFASLELSLQQLSAESRELVKGLAVLHGGGKVEVMAHILEIEVEAATQLCAELIQVGLADEKAYNYLRLDPALPSYLRLQWQDQQDYLQYQQRWSEVMSQLVDYLYQQRFKDAKLQSTLTQLELPNLMAFIRLLNQQLQAQQISAETVTDKAGRIEQLLENQNYPQALAELVSIRQQATQQLGEWNHARFETEHLTIERLLAQGDIQQAYKLAQKLLQQCEQAGAETYAVADYDLAYIYWLFGRVLKTGGASAEALPNLQQAQQRFEALGEQGARMTSVSLTELGGCLLDLGRLEQAAEAFQEAIELDEKRGTKRDVAVGEIQLATVRMQQKDYPAARDWAPTIPTYNICCLN